MPGHHQVVTSHENINLLSPASGSGSGSGSGHVRNNTKQLQEEGEIPKKGGKQWNEGKQKKKKKKNNWITKEKNENEWKSKCRCAKEEQYICMSSTHGSHAVNYDMSDTMDRSRINYYRRERKGNSPHVSILLLGHAPQIIIQPRVTNPWQNAHRLLDVISSTPVRCLAMISADRTKLDDATKHYLGDIKKAKMIPPCNEKKKKERKNSCR